MILVEDITKRLTDLKRMRLSWEPLWKDITDYVLPRRSFWEQDATPGQKPMTKTYDGTAIASVQLLSDGLQGNSVNQYLKWFHMVMENRKQQNLEDVPDWLEEVEEILYAEFARSNFYEAMSEFFLDASSLGTAVTFVEDDVGDKRILFNTRHLKECYLAESKTGTVDTVFREYTMTNRAAYQAWGNSLSQQRLDKAKTDPYGKAHIIHACYPRADRELGKIDGKSKAWSSVYIDSDHKELIDEGGFDSFPYLCWRWRKNSDEIYGRSPAADAIQDILRINQVGKTMLQAAQNSVEPPLNVPSSMRGTERIVPRGYNYYTQPNEMIYPINLAQNYPIGKDQQDDIKEQIRNVFRTRIFLLMEQIESGKYTATEIIERKSEGAVIWGATIGRLYSECLLPAIERVYTICERNGLLPPPPPTLAMGGRVHVEFQGPIAQAMKRYHESQGVTAGTQFLAGMVPLDPSGTFMDNADLDELARTGMDSAGMPQRVIRELSRVQAIRKARAEAKAQQQKEMVDLEQQKMLAANAEKLNEPLKPDSMLAGIGKAAQVAQKG